MNGALYPRVQLEKKARFVYFVDSVPQSVSVKESSVTRLVENMIVVELFTCEDPSLNGKVYRGSHMSSIALTLTLPDGSEKNVWGYIDESDWFGDMCKYYPHYSHR